MGFTRIQIGIAVGVAALLVFGFLGYIYWLSNQGPVLARSEERDTLTGLPVSIRMNPLRDRTIEHSANKFLRELRDGHCDELLSQLGARLPQEVRPLHLQLGGAASATFLGTGGMGERAAPDHPSLPRQTPNSPGQPGTYKEIFTVTTENKDGQWVVTKYDAMY